MGFALTLIYMALAYLSVADMFPWLAPIRINLILAILATLTSIPVILERRNYLRMPEFTLMWGFIGAILFSLLMVRWFGGMVIAMTKFLPSAIVLFLFMATCTTVRRVRITLWTLVVIACYLVFRGERAFNAYEPGMPHGPWLLEHKFYSGGNMIGDIITLMRVKALGIMSDPNDFGQFLVMSICILWMAWKPRRLVGNIFLVLLPAAWLFYGLFLTRSRGSLVGLVVVLMVVLYKKLGKFASVAVPATIVAGLLALGFSGGRAISMSGGADRISLWSDGLGMFKRSPLWGVCFGGFLQYANHTAHNSFVIAFAEEGLIGYFFFMALIVIAFMRLNKLSDDPLNDPKMRQTATILKYVLYAFLSTSWFLTRTYELTLYLLVGLAAALTLVKLESDHAGEVLPTLAPPHWVKWTLRSMVASIGFVYLMVRSRGL
jgi:putative inorganic carbon (hco3(-)) transporter